MHWSPPPGQRVAILDGDIIAYSCAAVAEDAPKVSAALAAAREMMWNFVELLNLDDHVLYLSGTGNFRLDVANSYKAHRKSEKPKYYWDTYEYLVNHWEAKVVDGAEADDAIGICNGRHPDWLVCSIDKDLLQLPGWSYNWRKFAIKHTSREEAARFVWYQMLIGDTADNIKGVPRIGPAKTAKLLDHVATEDLPQAVYQVYVDHGLTDEEFQINFKLLKILTTPSKKENWTVLERIEYVPR